MATIDRYRVVQGRLSDIAAFLKLGSAARHQLARSQGIYDMVLAVTRKSDAHRGAKSQAQKDKDYVLLQKAYNDHTINDYLRAKVICRTDKYETDNKMRCMP